MRNNLKYSSAPRRMHLNEWRAWPVVRVALIAAGALSCALLIALLAVPQVAALLRQRGAPVAAASPAPMVSASPAPAALLKNPVVTVAFSGVTATVVADPSVYGDRVLFAAGKSEGEGKSEGKSDTVFDRVVRYDPATGVCEEILLERAYDDVRNPVEDARAIAYLDLKTGGGGRVMAYDKQTGVCREVAPLTAGAPRLMLEYPYLVWTAREDDALAYLYAADLSAGAGEASAIAAFEGGPYAFSAPSLRSGQALYADASERAANTSRIRTILLHDGTRFDYEADLYVHDPVSNGNRWAFLTGDHGADSDLYLVTDGGAPRCIARGVIDCRITPTAVIYGRDETVYAYAFSDDKTYILSETGTDAQFVTAGGEVASGAT